MMLSLSTPHSLVHVGLVCADMERARESLSCSLGVTWTGGAPESWELVINGRRRTLEMRIAHAVVNGPATSSRYELIQSVPDSPWQTDAEVALHHLCFQSPDPTALCARLEAMGWERVLGRTGESCGYFQQPGGLLVEVVDDCLLAYLHEFYEQGN